MANVTDSFNRADGALGTAPTGQTWANFGGGALAIVGNQAQTSVASGDTGADIDSAQADATYQVTVVNASAGAGGLIFRKTDDINWWVAQIIGSTLYTRKFVAGAYTDLTDAVTVADGAVLTVVCSGNSITVKLNGATIRTLTDAFNNTATRGGMLARPGAQYDTFSITGAGAGNTNPTAAISAPASGSSYISGTNITFTGTGTDTEDGALTGASLAWSSSINGALGTGGTINVSSLSVGTHTITLTATDSGALTGTASITVTITAAGGGTPTAPTLPTTTPARVSIAGLSYTSTTVVTAATIQSTINAKASLAGNHEIIVQDGQLITTPVSLPVRTGATGYIVIRSQTMPCVAGIQAHPSMITTQAEFRTVGGGRAPVIATAVAAGVQKYILAGLYVTEAAGNDTNMLVALGSGSNDQNDVSLVPDDIQVERCVMRGDNCRRALAMHSGTTRVVDNWMSGSYLGQDAQAIHSANGTGPYLIEHNYLEGSGENIMFGGQSTFLVNVVPSDITFRLNTLAKPMTWYGHVRSVKNIFELKIGHRVLVEGNFFENNWADEQSGMAVLIKSVDQEGVAPWLGTADVTVRYNFARNIGGFTNLSADPEGRAVDMARVAVHNNVAVNLAAGSFAGGDERSWMAAGWTDGGMDYRIFHNTVVYKDTSDAAAMAWLTYPLTHFWMNDNIDVRNAGNYGVRADALAEGSAAFNGTTLGTSSLTRNVITGSGSPGTYPAGNFFPANTAAVGFVNGGILPTLDTALPDDVCAALTLAGTSTYKGVGDAGSDPGANMTLVRSFLPYTWVPGLRSDTLGAFTGPSANPLTGDPPVATALGVVTQPSSPVNTGVAHATQPAVEIRDQFGARKTDDVSTVTAALITVTGSGTAIGTLTKAAVAGLANFAGNGLGVTSAGGGTFKWRFTDGALTLAESVVFTVSAPPVATSLNPTVQPNDTATGAAHTVQPAVEIRDQFGARLTSDTSSVTASLVTVTGAGTAIGTLTKAAVAGLASFTDLGVTSAGGGTFRWHYTDGALTAADSAVFTVAGTPVVPGGSTGGGSNVRKWIQRREARRAGKGR